MRLYLRRFDMNVPHKGLGAVFDVRDLIRLQ